MQKIRSVKTFSFYFRLELVMAVIGDEIVVNHFQMLRLNDLQGKGFCSIGDLIDLT